MEELWRQSAPRVCTNLFALTIAERDFMVQHVGKKVKLMSRKGTFFKEGWMPDVLAMFAQNTKNLKR